MNKAISRLFVISVVLFAALILNLTWIMAVRADWYAERPENRRALAEELKIKRGVITGYDGSVIVSSRRHSGYYSREYPQGALASQLVGYSSVRYGRSGIEKQLNGELTGQTAALGLENWVDRLLGRRPAGADVKLTLVPAVQKAAQQALRGQKGAIVVLDPKTGALIASASAPNFDPGDLEDSWERLSQDASAPLLNRATQGLYTPGSAFKVVTATSGLDNGKVTPDTEFVDTGTYVVFGGKVTNYGGEVYGPNDFTTALTYSINTTFGKVGNLLGRKRLISSMEAFGFYKTPPLALPSGEVVPSGRYDEKGILSPNAFMDPLAVAWAACGQEQVLATPLQMALVAAAVANGGRVMEPYYRPGGRGRLGQRDAESAAAAVARGHEACHGSRAQRHDAARRQCGHRHSGGARGYPGGGQDRYGRARRRQQPGLVHRLRARGRSAGGDRGRDRRHPVDRRRSGRAAGRRRDQDGAGAAGPAMSGRQPAPDPICQRGVR